MKFSEGKVRKKQR